MRGAGGLLAVRGFGIDALTTEPFDDDADYSVKDETLWKTVQPGLREFQEEQNRNAAAKLTQKPFAAFVAREAKRLKRRVEKIEWDGNVFALAVRASRGVSDDDLVRMQKAGARAGALVFRT